MKDEIRDSLPTQAEIDAGPVCPRCGRRCWMSREAYDAIIAKQACELASSIDGRIADEVYTRMSGTVTLDEASK